MESFRRVSGWWGGLGLWNRAYLQIPFIIKFLDRKDTDAVGGQSNRWGRRLVEFEIRRRTAATLCRAPPSPSTSSHYFLIIHGSLSVSMAKLNGFFPDLHPILLSSFIEISSAVSVKFCQNATKPSSNKSSSSFSIRVSRALRYHIRLVIWRHQPCESFVLMVHY